MANLTTVADIHSDILFRGGENPTDTAGRFYPKIIEYINRANLDLHRGVCPLDVTNQVDFAWAKANPPIYLTLNPKYDTGTMLVTQGSTSVTLSVAPTNSLVGYRLLIDGANDIFRVQAHTAATTAVTLDSAFTGDTASAATFKAIPIDYQVGSNNVLRIVSPMRTFRNDNAFRDFKIRGLDPDKFDSYFPLRDIQSGIPTHYKIVYEADNNVFVQFNAYLDSGYARLEVPYIDVPTDLTIGSTPRCPREHRAIIADWALAFLQTDKSDSRAAGSLELAKAGFLAMANDAKYKWTDMDDTYAQIVPFMDELDIDNQGILRTDSGMVIG